ncbi:MAG: acylphosphatase [bacterium]|jgi:acylphosphatase
MRKCLLITITGSVQIEAYKLFIQKNAGVLGIEGTIQGGNDGLILHACGVSDKLDNFIDLLYKGIEKSKLKDILVEPFVTEKDYRGVFRIIG